MLTSIIGDGTRATATTLFWNLARLTAAVATAVSLVLGQAMLFGVTAAAAKTTLDEDYQFLCTACGCC
jgi:hypothetical protein